MTPPEFTIWFRYHLSRFPTVLAWFAKFPSIARSDVDPTQDDIRDAWESCLRGTALLPAQAATDRLFRGEDDLPRSFDEHPREVRRIANRLTLRAPGGSLDDLIPGETREETRRATKEAFQKAIAILSKSTKVPT